MLNSFTPIPDARTKSYENQGYWRNKPLLDFLNNYQHSTKIALIEDQAAITYAQLYERSTACAKALIGNGLKPNQTVLLQLPNSIGFVIALFGCLQAGVIPALCLPGHREKELTHLSTVAHSSTYLTTSNTDTFDYPTLAAGVDQLTTILTLENLTPENVTPENVTPANVPPDESAILPQLNPANPAVLLVSGGTTGLPKLIPRTHNDYLYNAATAAELCNVTSDDVYLAALPAAHNFTLACPGILGTLRAGGTVVMVPNPSPDSSFAAIERHKVTLCSLTPPLAQLWSHCAAWESADISSLRLLQIGGAKLEGQGVVDIQENLKTTVQQVFGMAEGLLCMTRITDDLATVKHTQGAPISPADEVRVVDESDNDVPVGTVGQLLVRGPYTIAGYFNAAAANATSFTNDGFYRSGDLVQQHDNGYLTVSGRVKDVINRGGETISAAEIEKSIIDHPGVKTVAVIAVPDNFVGEKIGAVVVLTESCQQLKLNDLRGFLTKEGLAAEKLPESLRIVDTLPITSAGKIDKKALQRNLVPSAEN